MIINNYFKRLYAAYFTNANIWVVQYDGGFYCNELCSKIEAKFITSKCPGSKMYIYNPFNKENQFWKLTPLVLLRSIAWNISIFSLVYLVQLVLNHLIFDDNQKAQELTNRSFKLYLITMGIYYKVKSTFNYLKE